MIDTIRVKFPVSPTPEQLESWTHRVTRTPTGIRQSYIYNPEIDATVLRLTYFPTAYDGNPMLTLETSLPKLVLDNNYQMIGSIDGAIKIANLVLKDVPNIPLLDLGEGILIRLDMCHNHQVGDAVEDYIMALGSLDYPHRRTKHHRYEGVEFRAKHKTTKFYDKQRECGESEAYGILRQEITLIRGKDIQKAFHVPRPTLLDLPEARIAELLREELLTLGLLDQSIATRNTALEHLSASYGSDAGLYYFGLLASKLDKSKKQLARETEMHPRSLDRKLRRIRQAGIPLTLTDRDVPLPPLTISD